MTLNFWSDKLKSFSNISETFPNYSFNWNNEDFDIPEQRGKDVGILLFFHELFDCEVGPDPLDVAVRLHRGI